VIKMKDFWGVNNNILYTFAQKLSDIGIDLPDVGFEDNMYFYKNGKEAGTIRIYIERGENVGGLVVLDNIFINKNMRRKGLAFAIHEKLYQSAKEHNLGGLFSPLYSRDISQKRSKITTRIMEKLIRKYGGEKMDVSEWMPEEDKDGDIYDYLIDGRGSIETYAV